MYSYTKSAVEVRSKVFVCYHHYDEAATQEFVQRGSDVFIPRGLGLRFDEDDLIRSDNPEYVMRCIREKIIQDSSVTIVLIGPCTHSRRYVDWEIKASLCQRENEMPNGLIGILLPGGGLHTHLPPRLHANLSPIGNSYARLYHMPQSANQLRAWIEDAKLARLSRAALIRNTQDMMRCNAQCRVCGIVH